MNVNVNLDAQKLLSIPKVIFKGSTQKLPELLDINLSEITVIFCLLGEDPLNEQENRSLNKIEKLKKFFNLHYSRPFVFPTYTFGLGSYPIKVSRNQSGQFVFTLKNNQDIQNAISLAVWVEQPDGLFVLNQFHFIDGDKPETIVLIDRVRGLATSPSYTRQQLTTEYQDNLLGSRKPNGVSYVDLYRGKS